MEKVHRTSAAHRIGRRVRELREERGWTQNELAAKSGMVYQAVSRLESGKHPPNVATLERLAEAFGVEMRDPF
jgi:transcriptional regulator with XRE-family HTH domain